MSPMDVCTEYVEFGEEMVGCQKDGGHAGSHLHRDWHPKEGGGTAFVAVEWTVKLKPEKEGLEAKAIQRDEAHGVSNEIRPLEERILDNIRAQVLRLRNQRLTEYLWSTDDVAGLVLEVDRLRAGLKGARYG